MNDFVLNVRQIMEYPLKGESSEADAILLQTGGLGGPYAWSTAYGVVRGALDWAGANLGVGVLPPSDAAAAHVFTKSYVGALGGGYWFNGYQDSLGIDRYWDTGPAALMFMDPSDGLYQVIIYPPGTGGSEIPDVPPQSQFQLTFDGMALLPFNTLIVARDPTADLEVATKHYVDVGLAALYDLYDNSTVWSFNGRTGNVSLLLLDITGAGGAPIDSPNFIGNPTAPTLPVADASDSLATTAYVHDALEWFSLNGVVRSFNGRMGDIELLLSDVTGAGGAPIDSPAFTGLVTVPQPAPGSNSGQVPSTSWVRNFVASVESGLEVQINSIVTVATSPPSNPRLSDLWWDSSDTLHGGALYIWYIDGGRGSWVVANSQEGAIGPQGPPGSSIKGSFDTLADLEAAIPVGAVGDAYLVAGDMYVWSEDLGAWINVGTLVGPPGPTGLPGPAGPPIHVSPIAPIGATQGEGWFDPVDRTLRFHILNVWEEIGYLRRSFDGDVVVPRNLTVEGHARIEEWLWVEEDITADRDLFANRNMVVGEDLTITRDLSVGREAELHGTLSVREGAEFHDEVDFRDDVRMHEDLDVSGDLRVRGERLPRIYVITVTVGQNHPPEYMTPRITHNLGTTDVIVQVYSLPPGAAHALVLVDTIVINPNQVQLELQWDYIPTGTRQFRVVVIG